MVDSELELEEIREEARTTVYEFSIAPALLRVRRKFKLQGVLPV